MEHFSFIRRRIFHSTVSTLFSSLLSSYRASLPGVNRKNGNVPSREMSFTGSNCMWEEDISLVVSARFLLRFGDDSEASVYRMKEFELVLYDLATASFYELLQGQRAFSTTHTSNASPLLLPTSPPVRNRTCRSRECWQSF